MNALTLQIITQEKKILEEAALSVTLPGSEGEMTILPGHMNLFTPIKPGTVTVKTPTGHEDKLVAVHGGFVAVSPTEVKILADTALRAEDIDEAKAEQAKIEAQQAMKNRDDKQKFYQAESSLRQALLELETAKKWKKFKSV